MSNDIFSIPIINTATLFVPSITGYNTDSWSRFSNIIVGDYVAETNTGDMTFACYTVKGEGDEPSRCAILTKAATNITEALIKSGVEAKAEGSDVVKTYKVLSIGKNAFLNCGNLSKLELPSSLTSIGNQVFASSDKIKTIISLCKQRQDKDDHQCGSWSDLGQSEWKFRYSICLWSVA